MESFGIATSFPAKVQRTRFTEKGTSRRIIAFASSKAQGATMRSKVGLVLVCAAATAAASCETAEKAPVVNYQNAKWAGNGWRSPQTEPEVIGLYLSREECDAAVAEWASGQAASDFVRAECLPIDRR
jgi:hypothetical protein